MTVRAALSFLTLFTLLLGGCADSSPADRPFKPFAVLMRGDDQSLTKAEQAAAIKQLEDDKTKQQQASGEEGATPPPKTAQ